MPSYTLRLRHLVSIIKLLRSPSRAFTNLPGPNFSSADGLIAGNAEHLYCHHRGPIPPPTLLFDTRGDISTQRSEFLSQCPALCYPPTWRRDGLRISRTTTYPLYRLQPQHRLLVHQVAQNIRGVENYHACTLYRRMTLLSDVNISLKSLNRAPQQNCSTYLLQSHPDSNVISSVSYQRNWLSTSWLLLMTHGLFRA